MNKICTSLEQSKKLIELGIDRKTSDLYYWCGSDLRIGGYKAQDEELDIPAWTLAALLGVLPKIINHETLFIETSALLWHIGYRNIYIAREDNLLDACYELVCWLKENGDITDEDLNYNDYETD